MLYTEVLIYVLLGSLLCAILCCHTYEECRTKPDFYGEVSTRRDNQQSAAVSAV